MAGQKAACSGKAANRHRRKKAMRPCAAVKKVWLFVVDRNRRISLRCYVVRIRIQNCVSFSVRLIDPAPYPQFDPRDVLSLTYLTSITYFICLDALRTGGETTSCSRSHSRTSDKLSSTTSFDIANFKLSSDFCLLHPHTTVSCRPPSW